MNRYTNPFHILEEVSEVFRSLGIDPLRCNIPLEGDYIEEAEAHDTVTEPDPSVFHGFAFKKDDEMSMQTQVCWADHILSVVVQRTYEKATHYHTCGIHLTREGFEIVKSIIGAIYPVQVEKHLSQYYEHFIEPSPLLRLYTLVPKEDA